MKKQKELNATQKSVKKALYLLVGIPAAMVIILFCILIYNNHLHEKNAEAIRNNLRSSDLYSLLK